MRFDVVVIGGRGDPGCEAGRGGGALRRTNRTGHSNNLHREMSCNPA